MELPKQDSATGRGLKTIVQTMVGFTVGLGIAIWQVPGVPDVIMNYLQANFLQVFLTIGVPVALSSGVTSFLWNLILRKSVTTY